MDSVVVNKEDLATAANPTATAPDRVCALQKLLTATGASGTAGNRESVGQAAAGLLCSCMAALSVRPCSAMSQSSEHCENGTRQKTEVELLFRLIRNTCMQSSAAEAFIEAGLLPKMAAAVTTLLEDTGESRSFELQAAAQLIANLTVAIMRPEGSESVRNSAWAASFPGLFGSMASVTKHEVQGPICFALVTFCRGSHGRARQLTENQARLHGSGDLLPPLIRLLDATAEGQGGGTDLDRLLGVLVYEHGLLEEILSAASSAEKQQVEPSSEGAVQASYSVELLQELAEGAWACFSYADLEPGLSSGCGRSLSYLVEFIRTQAREVSANPSARLAVEKLQMALQFLRSLTAAEENSDPSKEATYRAIMDMMCDAGMVELLLAMIKALPPVKPAGAAATREQCSTDSSSGQPSGAQNEPDLPVIETCGMLAPEASLLPSWNVFQGYRSYLVAVVGNMAFKQGSVQQRVLDLGGVELLLAQCQVDEESPMLREWGLWAIRNLTEGSDVARQRIRDLEVCQTVDSPELRAMGKQVEYDPAKGKMKLVDSPAHTK